MNGKKEGKIFGYLTSLALIPWAKRVDYNNFNFSMHPDTCNHLGMHNLYKICYTKRSSSEENRRDSEGTIGDTCFTRANDDGPYRTR